MTLRDSGVKFVAAGLPEANTTTVGVMALVAQQEREAISVRYQGCPRGCQGSRQEARRSGLSLATLLDPSAKA
jgi:hypothetical protein